METKKTILVVGAGPGIGLAVARRWGAEGYNVALVARNEERMAGLVDQLTADGVEAVGYRCDVTDRDAFRGVLAQVKERFGHIDTLYYGPPAAAGTMVPPRAFSVDHAAAMLDLVVLGAVTAVEAVLPEMIERGEGTLLFCAPLSAVDPVLFSANYAMACAALRNYAHGLYVDLAGDGVYAGTVLIGGIVVEGDTERVKTLAKAAANPGDRELEEYRTVHLDKGAEVASGDVARTMWGLATDRDEVEAVLGDPEICLRLRKEALAGRTAS